MTNFVLIFLCFFLGKCFSHLKRFPQNTAETINAFIVFVSLPAMIFSKLPSLLSTMEFSGHWWIPVSMSWLMFLLSYLIISKIGSILSWSSAKTGALILVSGLANTSFVGFPILEAILGKEAIPIGILADQPGSFLILSTAGIFVAAKYSGKDVSIKYIFSKMINFPPFLAMVVAILWSIIGRPGDVLINEVCSRISETLVPLALFSVGFKSKFDFNLILKRRTPLLIGIGLKLILFPMFFYVFYIKILNVNDFFVHVTILESAMATQITSAVVASEFQLDSELANLMVAITIPLSLITVFLINIGFFK